MYTQDIITTDKIKKLCIDNGAVLCGIASAERFYDFPEGFGPQDIMEDCKSVIVVAMEFPKSCLSCKIQSPYTFVRNTMVKRVDDLTFDIAFKLEKMGIKAVAVPSAEPYEFWDEEKSHGKGILSLKHAAVLAGLGKIGKNTLLVNKTYGNMIWLGAILIDIKLEPDDIADYETCPEKCNICLKSCPVSAIDGKTIVQKKCREHAFKFSDGGGFLIRCNKCRTICPNSLGLK